MRPTVLNPLFSSVFTLEGVGPKMGKLLARLLLGNENATPTVRDLLFHLPTQLVDRRYSPKIFEAEAGRVCTFQVTVEAHQAPSHSRYSNRPYRILCTNASGTLTVALFNARPEQIKQQFPIGRECVISGRVEKYEYALQMAHPDIVAPVSDLQSVLRVEPVYPLTDGLTQRRMKQWVNSALLKLPQLPEWLSPEVLASRGLPSFNAAIQAVHSPHEEEDIYPFSKPRMRLALDELLALQLSYARARAKTRAKPGRMAPESQKLVPALLPTLPFALTNGQHLVFQEIEADISSGKRMVRLLQGDVGSGKTIVALMAMLQMAESRLQAALMVPTELVAEQHFNTITALLAPLNMAPVLLTGSVKGKAREEVKAKIESGQAKIIIGTHALFQEHVEFNDLALIVVDEQHRFGVEQRMALAAKGNAPHILHLSATPIPRSMTLMLYGDMDASILKEKPAERKPITTTIAPAARRADLSERLKSAIARGEKAYWICPLIEDMTLVDADVAAVESRYKEFQASFGKGVVGLAHGRMKAEARNRAMDQFRAGAVTLLVATTVVEVGVDVRDATIMVIEQAERFGLSQLHQLRGRVGRGDKPSYCVLLLSENATDEARERLKILTETEDGFAIAEADLQARGGGELLGKRQSGLPALHFADLSVHAHLLSPAKAEADRLVSAGKTEEIEMVTALFL